MPQHLLQPRIFPQMRQVLQVLPTQRIQHHTGQSKDRVDCSLVREPNPAHQVLEARVRAQGFKYRIAFEKREPEIALLKAFFKPGERFILVAEANVDFREVGGRHISFLRQLLQIRNHLAGVCGAAHSAVNITDRRVGFCREVPCFLQFVDGLLEPALLGEGLAEVKMGGPEARLEIQSLAQLGKSLIVAPRLIQGL